jgi:hypothetical protein
MQVFVPRSFLAALTLAAFVASNVPPAAAAGTAAHFVANGDSASLLESNPDDGSFIQVDVSRGGTLQNPQTFLVYFICLGRIPLCQEGFGLIPNSDFQTTATSQAAAGHMSLNTDTSAAANPGFVNLGSSGGVVSGGVISVAWDKTSISSGSVQTISTQVFTLDNGTSRMHLNVHQDFVSASATGSILGLPLDLLSPVFAQMASRHSSEIDICKGC